MGDKSIKGKSKILFDPLLKKRVRGKKSKLGVDPNKIKEQEILLKRPMRQIPKMLKNGW